MRSSRYSPNKLTSGSVRTAGEIPAVYPAVDSYIAQRAVIWGSLCYPHTTTEKLFALLRQIDIIVVMDDEFAEPEVQGDEDRRRVMRDHYLAALCGVEPPPGHPFVQLLYDLLRSLMTEIRPRVGVRLLHSMAELVEILADPINPHIDTLSLDRYLELRRVEIFGYWVTVLTEYAVDVDMTDELRADRCWRRSGTGP